MIGKALLKAAAWRAAPAIESTAAKIRRNLGARMVVI
jgi:hypothetical protein